MRASHSAFLQRVESILITTSKVRITRRDEEGRSVIERRMEPLLLLAAAARAGNTGVVDALLAAKANIFAAESMHGATALYHAIKSKHHAISMSLLAAAVCKRDQEEDAIFRFYECYFPLSGRASGRPLRAAWPITRDAIEKHLNFYHPRDETTAVLMTAERADIEILKALVRAGAKMSERRLCDRYRLVSNKFGFFDSRETNMAHPMLAKYEPDRTLQAQYEYDKSSISSDSNSSRMGYERIMNSVLVAKELRVHHAVIAEEVRAKALLLTPLGTCVYKCWPEQSIRTLLELKADPGWPVEGPVGGPGSTSSSGFRTGSQNQELHEESPEGPDEIPPALLAATAPIPIAIDRTVLITGLPPEHELFDKLRSDEGLVKGFEAKTGRWSVYLPKEKRNISIETEFLRTIGLENNSGVARRSLARTSHEGALARVEMLLRHGARRRPFAGVGARYTLSEFFFELATSPVHMSHGAHYWGELLKIFLRYQDDAEEPQTSPAEAVRKEHGGIVYEIWS